MLQNASSAFAFNGIPLVATGLIYLVCDMVAIFVNSLWQHPAMFFDAVASVENK